MLIINYSYKKYQLECYYIILVWLAPAPLELLPNFYLKKSTFADKIQYSKTQKSNIDVPLPLSEFEVGGAVYNAHAY